MSNGRGDNQPQEPRRVLQGYRQDGKRFIPPLLQLGPLHENEWMDDRVPELIWIALLNQTLGTREGTAAATAVAKAAAACAPATKKAFAAASDYAQLTDDEKHCVLSKLNGEDVLGEIRSSLAVLANCYPDFPLKFLLDTYSECLTEADSTLDNLKSTIANISDRQSSPAVFAQATVVYINFINEKLKVSPNVSLANFPAIEDYPLTEESQKVAAGVRSAVVSLLSLDVPQQWRNSFWNQGRILSKCEIVK